MSDYCYPKGYAAPGNVQCQCNMRRSPSKLNCTLPQPKIDVTSKSLVGDISVATLIRTDTTLDHSQKAEKVWSMSLDIFQCDVHATKQNSCNIVVSCLVSFCIFCSLLFKIVPKEHLGANVHLALCCFASSEQQEFCNSNLSALVLMQCSEKNNRYMYHSVHFITHQSFAFY